MTDDLVKRLQKYLDGCPLPDCRTFHLMHEETLIAEAKDRIEALEAALRDLIDASSCIRHWHDALNGDGMVVSAEHVMLLWGQTDIARAALAGEKKDVSSQDA